MSMICPNCGRSSQGFDATCPECGDTLPLDAEFAGLAAVDENAEDLTGQSIGHFRIDSVLGRGGMGVVYRATDAKLERSVALKFISKEMAANPTARQRFEREARAAARLDDPSVGAIYEVGQHRGRPWIAMAYYSGQTLAQRLEAGPLGMVEAQQIAFPLIDALDAAHKAGIVHRDVKPANIMLTAEGQVKLLDFGLAKLETASAMTGTHQMMGTLAYMAPEQLQAEEVDARADLWAVAVVWVEMLTGRSPFRGGKGLALIASILNREPDLDGVPDVLHPILRRCLAKKAEGRPESMEALRSELAAAGFSSELTDTPQPASLPTSSPGTQRRWRGAAALFAVGVILVFVVGLDRSGPSPGPSPSAVTSAPSPSVAKLRRIAVAPPQAEIEVPGAEPEISRTGVRIAILRALTGLDGLRILPPEQLEGLPGSVVEQAKAAGANEVLTSDLHCEPIGCSLELALLRSDDHSVAWSDVTNFSWGDKHLAALATATTVRRAFPEHAAREEALLFEMTKEDFLELATLWNAYDKRSLPRRELLDRLSALRRRAPGFVEIHQLEIDVARLLFFDTRDGAYLDHGSRIAEQARQLAPWNAMPLYNHFDLAREGRRIEEAEVVLAELERLRPGEAGVLQCQAQLAELKGDAETAIEKMTAAVRLRPTWRRLQTLANMEFRQGRVAAARDHAEQLLTLSPDNYEGLRLLANFELMIGEPRRAESLFERLVADRPELPDLMALGTARLIDRRYSEAERTFRRVLELGDHPGAHLNLADCLALQGRQAEARAFYESTLELLAEDPTPDSLMVLLVKAQALAHLGRASEAVAAAQAALMQSPKNAQVAFEVSLVQAVVGERHSALLNAERALEGGVNPHWFELEWFDPLSAELRPLLQGGAD